MEERTQGALKIKWDDYSIFDTSKYHFAVMKRKIERYPLNGEIPSE